VDYDVERSFSTRIAAVPARSSRRRGGCSRRIPACFRKQLTSDIESSYEVALQTFKTEHEEATWLIADLGKEPDAAILYRKHRLGEYLEAGCSAPESRAGWRAAARSSRTP